MRSADPVGDFDRVHREGVDVQTAFASRLRLAQSELDTAPLGPGVPGEAYPIAPQAVATGSIPRRIARAVYHACKPLIRPFAVRVRAYLMAPLMDQIVADRAQTEATGRELRQSTQALGRQLLESNEQIDRRLRESNEQIDRRLRESNEQIDRRLRESNEKIDRRLRGSIDEMDPARHALDEIRRGVASQAKVIESLVRDSAAIASFAGVAARRVAVPAGPGEILVRTEVGYVFCASDDHAVLVALIENGDLERGTRQLIERILRPGDTFVDVGAHIGLHTLAAARVLRGSGRVIAIEPSEVSAGLLQRSVALNGLTETVTVHVTAAGGIDGHASLFIGAVSSHHSLYPLDPPEASAVGSVDVPVARLDSLLAGEPHVDLIKIDAEGAELEVLEGARSTVSLNPDIGLIVEFGPSHLVRTGHTVAEWFATLGRLGVEFRAIDENGGLETRSIEDLMTTYSVNLFFARPGSQLWARALDREDRELKPATATATGDQSDKR
jgi:FkbM family methyltransferase